MIGSSEIAMLFGLSPHGGPHALWRRKTGREGPREATPATERSKQIKVALRDWYSQGIPYTGEIAETRAARGVASVRADGLWGEAVLWCKCVHFTQREKWGDPGTDAIPAHEILRCQWLCYATEAQRCDVAADFGDSLALYSVPRSDEAIGKMVSVAEAFWRDQVETDTPPELDVDDATNRWLNSAQPYQGSYREATPDEIDLITTARDHRADMAALRSAKAGVEIPLKEAIGDLDGLTIRGEPAASYRPNKAGNRLLRLL